MPTFSFKQMHHAYIGIPIMLGAYAMHWQWVFIAGALIVLDDVVEHLVQEATGTDWKSPLLWVYSKIYPRVAWIRRLNTWLDNLFN